jgi:hypothetical protein
MAVIRTAPPLDLASSRQEGEVILPASCSGGFSADRPGRGADWTEANSRFPVGTLSSSATEGKSMQPLLIIVGADKGGVGKTTVSRTLMDWFAAQGMDARGFDTQVPKGVFKRFHSSKVELVDITTVDGQMRVFDTLNVSPVTVLDLAASLLKPVLAALRETGFVQKVAEGKAQIAVLHIVGSSVASLDEVKTIAQDVAGLQLFIVSNPVSDAPISKEALIGFSVIDFPKLNDHTYQAIDKASLPVTEFVATQEATSPTLAGYARGWLGRVFAALEITRFHR